MQKGLSESLAGRFELHRHNHWSFKECKECFSLSLKEYLFFGGYPGALPLRHDEERWASYIRDSLIETVLSKDILLMNPLSKPMLLRQTFGIAISQPTQIISYQKMLNAIENAGSVTTIKSCMHLLNNAFLIAPLEKYSGSKIKQKGSIPKILVFDNSLITATSRLRYKDILTSPMLGRLTENSVGMQLYNLAQKYGGELFYWRDRDEEVDYVIKIGNITRAFEIKSSKTPQINIKSLDSFRKHYNKVETFIISGMTSLKLPNIRHINLDTFFSNPEIALK